MVHINGLKKRYGPKLLFENLDLHIRQRDRIALVGENGSGKTTLMKILCGLEDDDAGTINRAGNIRTGYLPQFLPFSYNPEITLFDEARKAFSLLYEKAAKLTELELLMGEVEYDSLEYEKVTSKYSQLTEEMKHEGYYELDSRVRIVLFGLGFTEQDLEKKCVHFSGGWQMRIMLARILIEKPDLLLLDEPTNHLDIESSNWLLEFIRGYPGAVMLVSHDRYFLDALVKRVAELYNSEMKVYTGNYTQFETAREEYIDSLHRQAEEYEQAKEKAERFIDRFRAKASKASAVQSRIKMVEKMEVVKIPPKRKKIRFRFPKAQNSGLKVLKVQDLAKQFGEKVVFMGAEFEVERGDRVAVLGKNGSGKTTLIKIIAGRLPQDMGEAVQGHNVQLDYYAQEPSEVLNHQRTVIEEMSCNAANEQIPLLRDILGAFLFHDDDIYKKVEVLSGGERSRLALARLLLRKSNLLVLDEPTNHLDIYSKDVLLDALRYFEGTIIFVSHDRYFIDQLANKIVYIQDGEVTSYTGNYEEYLAHRERKRKLAEEEAREKDVKGREKKRRQG
ncbi:MAG: ABC-F family ATP-binding cassette domain-containing protein [Candidatus Wallbacteria bacterium]|nr:ABC-F family ATP-binding cassette domain-containing protein [Candidatus Wallbacteria bacterium]